MSLTSVFREIMTENVGADRIRYLAKGVIWQFRKRVRHRFVTTLHNGVKVMVLPTSAYSAIFYAKWPERKDIQFIRRHSDLGDLFVDVGANVGLFSALLFDSFKQFILFEPSPSSFRAMNETLRLNPKVNARGVNIGVADVAGELAFLDLGDCSSTSRFQKDGNCEGVGQVVMVRCDTLDNQLADVPGDLVVKIDVEGFEERVFYGGRQLLLEKRLRLIMFERLGRTDIQRVRSFLDSCGYRIFYVNDDGAISFDDDAVLKPMVNLFAAPSDIAADLQICKTD